MDEDRLYRLALPGHVLELAGLLTRWRSKERRAKDDGQIGNGHGVDGLSPLDPATLLRPFVRTRAELTCEDGP
jgi:hypothetical protein